MSGPEDRERVEGSDDIEAEHGVVDREPDNWKHRSEGMRCRTCMYYVPKASKAYLVGSDPHSITEIDTNGKVGRCRRHAPTMNGWPVMFPTDWCGDHKLDETK